jgi:hypothetical protein
MSTYGDDIQVEVAQLYIDNTMRDAISIYYEGDGPNANFLALELTASAEDAEKVLAEVRAMMIRGDDRIELPLMCGVPVLPLQAVDGVLQVVDGDAEEG